MFGSLHDFAKVEDVDKRQQGADDLPNCVLASDGLRHQRCVEDDIAGHVSEHGSRSLRCIAAVKAVTCSKFIGLVPSEGFRSARIDGRLYCAAVAIPSFAAIRRAVSSRFAVMLATDWRARSRICGGAVSGVPLLNGGSGA